VASTGASRGFCVVLVLEQNADVELRHGGSIVNGVVCVIQSSWGQQRLQLDSVVTVCVTRWEYCDVHTGDSS